jgi:hypothetical protein
MSNLSPHQRGVTVHSSGSIPSSSWSRTSSRTGYSLHFRICQALSGADPMVDRTMARFPENGPVP